MVSVQDFCDGANDVLCSGEVVLVTHDDRAAGVFLPWASPELHTDVRREVFLRLSDEIAVEREAQSLTEGEVLGDFATGRRRRSDSVR